MKQEEIETYLLHSTLPSFTKKITRSKMIIKEFLVKCNNPYVAWSTGKDSTAVLGLVREIADIPAVHIDTGVELPGTDETREKMDNVIHFCPEKGFFEIAEIYGLGTKETRKSRFVSEFEKKHSFNGVFIGLRAEESLTRRYNAKRGSIYQRKDGFWVCMPIINWTIKDVFAYLFSKGLPIHPHYLKDGPFPTEQRRVGSYVSSRNRGAEYGRFVQLKYFYPEIYDELAKKFPELKQYI